MVECFTVMGVREGGKEGKRERERESIRSVMKMDGN